MSASSEHAIVYGGSMVGLVTAGVLSRHFARVTLVERDVYGDALQPRKGVPQALLNHALLTRGMRVFQEIFPALEQRLVEAGGPRFDMGADQGWFAHGGWRPRVDCGLRAFSVSRLLLESVVRERAPGHPPRAGPRRPRGDGLADTPGPRAGDGGAVEGPRGR
ncbi:hypothetical protein [Melittangium boletus]|uniref:hypothetical protein n=1 Tax=Melittangium boletus TaxID=83453 RepID=UPI003DA42A0D